MEFLIISGLSGAGKSQTMDVLEDLNYYCVDNMPVVLIPKFAELCIATSRYEKVALVTDVREKESMSQLFEALDMLWELGCDYKILFVEADIQTIVKRYKETRRRHPLGGELSSVEEAVHNEIEYMWPIRERADYVINTTNFKTADLQSEIYDLFIGDTTERALRVNIVSFGFKYGLPLDADLVFDVRFLPNPFYVEALRPLTGLDAGVYDFVFENGDAAELMHRLTALLDFLLPLYVEEGKYSLTIAVGCTGGKHRSVAVAQELVRSVSAKGHNARLINRDIEKDRLK
jgi:Predicted P-loop-containing kinase